MHIVDFGARGFLCGAVCLAGLTLSAWAEEAPSPVPDQRRATGVVVEMIGGPAQVLSGGSSRLVRLGDFVTVGEEIQTPGGTRVALLWDHRAVLTLHEKGRLQIDEPHGGQLELRLHRGMMRIALSYNAGRMTDRLLLQTSLARVVLRGGILEATVEDGASRSLLARLLNSSSAETLRIVEGQAQVEPLTGERKSFSLKTGSEVSLTSGAAASVRALESDARRGTPRDNKEERRGVPDTITRQIVTAHIPLAVEAEQELQRARRAATEKEPLGNAVIGTILPTTTGLPLSSSVQALGTGGSAGSSLPPTSSFSIPAPSNATPLQGAGSLGPAQSGGRNTNELLEQLVKEAAKGSKDRGKK